MHSQNACRFEEEAPKTGRFHPYSRPGSSTDPQQPSQDPITDALKGSTGAVGITEGPTDTLLEACLNAGLEVLTTMPSKRQRDVAKERRHLLKDVAVHLNDDGSIYIHMGVDPFIDFKPLVRIVKNPEGLGVNFTRNSFNYFVEVLPKILADLEAEKPLQYKLWSYTVVSGGGKTAKFIPNNNNNNADLFVLCVSAVLLNKLLEKSVYVNTMLGNLAKKRSVPKLPKYYKQMAMCVINTSKILDNDLLIEHLDADYFHDYDLYEMVFKFTTIVVEKINNLVGLFKKHKRLF